MAEESNQAVVNINGTQYRMDDLSDNAKAQLQSLVFTQNEVKRLQAQLAVAKTAQQAYQQALTAELPSS